MRSRTRFVAFLLVVILAISLSPVSSLAATNPFLQTVGNADFYVSTAFCAHGETTKLFVDISADSQMSAGLFTLRYDTTMLKAKSVDIGVVLKNGNTSTNITDSGIVKVSYADVNPSYEAGRIFEVEFEAIGTVPNDQTFVDIPVELEVTDLRNYEDYPIASKVTDGKVTLIERHYGDVDSSGEVSASDALLTLYDNARLITLDDNQKTLADVNGDGKVTVTDALQILQYSAGYISNYTIFQLPKPSGLTVTDKEEESLTVSWSEIPYVLGYNVFLDGTQVNTVPVTAAEYSLNNLTQDTKYNIEIQAVNALMGSQKSDKLTVTTNKAERMVVFKDYDGTVLENQIVLSGTAADPPQVPGRKGYTFIGWDADTNNITTDVTITAQYQINTYTVTLDYLYNDQSIVSDYVFGTEVECPEAIQRDNFTLEGWYRDKNYIKKWNFDSDAVEDNMVLYAKWVTWSEWTTDTSLLDNSMYEVQSKTQYSYSDKETTTSTSSSLSGWINDGSTVSYGNWTNVGWTKNKPTESDTLRITDTKTVTDSPAYTNYNYYYYRYWNSSAGTYYYTYGSGMGGTLYQKTLTSPMTYYNNYDGHNAYTKSGGGYYNFAGEIWFLSSQNNVAAKTHTEWYYQTRTKTITYKYYRWTPYSAWSDNAYTESDTRRVQTRTVYRYLLKQQ